ncbi:hypothetical protein HanRHA438_Chr16g0736731 [Helianthus annuus]|nr:hypothetical protein HanRHA438_Chr16g0736731 [Helianthus annuus]
MTKFTYNDYNLFILSTVKTFRVADFPLETTETTPTISVAARMALHATHLVPLQTRICSHTLESTLQPDILPYIHQLFNANVYSLFMLIAYGLYVHAMLFLTCCPSNHARYGTVVLSPSSVAS